jgi:acetolactate synthase-1/2/3 large subunit
VSEPADCTGAELVLDILADEGVEVVFGYPGGAIMPIYDALYEHRIHHVLTRHEAAAAFAAGGYARSTGRVGVCMATSGPGATNLVTGILDAQMDSIPLVAITGQVRTTLMGTDGFQEADVTSIMGPVTKRSVCVRDVRDLERVLRAAFRIARGPRPGPVLVDIPNDILKARCEVVDPRAARAVPAVADRPSQDDIEATLELLRHAKRPVAIVGGGARSANATHVFREFCSLLGLPYTATINGLGCATPNDPNFLGMLGMHGWKAANLAVNEADVVLALGMRFDDRVTGNLASYAPNAKKIHIEIDPSEIDKNVRVDVALIGDLKGVLQTLLPLLDRKSDLAWLREINQSKGTAAVRDIVNLPDNGHLYAAHVINDIWREAVAAGREKDTIIVTDVGQHQMWEAQYFKHEAPRSLVTSGGLGTMGFALPAAIGAKFACPHKDVWVIAGDGGFQMTAAELSTIVQERLHINIAVINNGFLGMVRQWQEAFYDKNYAASPILSPDFVMLAAAHGIAGAKISKRKNVTETVTKARTSGKAFLIDFQVQKEDGVYPMIAPGAALHEMVRRPVHDPLLETAEDA